jgi:hypothetical protein
VSTMSVDPKRVPVIATGVSLGLFLSISFVLCVALGIIVPEGSLHKPWLQFLPGFSWLTWSSFFLGLCWSFAYGLYIAIIFVPLYNFFARVGAEWW